MHVLPFVIILFLLVCLNGDYRRCSVNRRKLGNKRDDSGVRVEVMHPWVHEEWRVSGLPEYNQASSLSGT